jgi:hypothetical protein
LTLLGFALTSSFQIIAAQPLAITIQPSSQTNVSVGSTVTFTAGVSGGTGTLRFQWLLNGVNLPTNNVTATTTNLVLANVQPSDSGRYSMLVADNKNNASNTDEALLLVNVPFLIGQDYFTNATPLPTLDNSKVPPVAITDYTISSDNFGKTKESGEPLHDGKKGGHSVWYKWTAPFAGTVTFTTAGSDFDTLLGAYQGSAVSSLANVVSPDFEADDEGGFLTSKIVFSAVAGQDYYIAVDGFGKDSGHIILHWKLDTNVTEVLPILTTRPHSKVFSTNDSTSVLVGFFNPSSVTEGRWYFNEGDTGNTNNTFGSFRMDDTRVGTYYVQVKTTTGRKIKVAEARFQINIQANGTADTNQFTLDKFLDAIDKSTNGYSLNSVNSSSSGPTLESYGPAPETGGPAAGYTSTQIFSTTSSGKDPDEPNHCGLQGGASEWFSYQPTNSGTLQINTDGSGFPTILAVYTNAPPGTGFSNLVAQGCDSGSDGGNGSRVLLPATPGIIYYIVVDGLNGAAGTAKLNINLGDPVIVTNPPSSLVVTQGATATFSVGAVGTALSYRWYNTNGVLISGANSSSYSVTNVTAGQTGTYTVVVSNLVNQVTNTATLSLATPPAITLQPTNQTVNLGSTLIMVVAATGSDPLTYQWRFAGGTIVGTNATLVLPNIQPTNAGNYRAVVSNPYGFVTSAAPAVLTVNYPPVITTQPASHSAVLNASASLSVVAAGVPAPTYQWQLNGVDIPLSNTNVLTIPNFQSVNEGAYRVIATNALGSVASSNAFMYLNAPARLSSFNLGPNGFQIQVFGVAGSNYVVQVSSNLVNWTSLVTNSDPSGVVIFTDAASTNSLRRFYRAKTNP